MAEVFVRRRRSARQSLAQPAPDCVPGPAADELGSMAEAFVNLPDAVVLVDGTGTVVWGNRAAERLFELSLDDWIGQSGLELVHPDDHEFV